MLKIILVSARRIVTPLCGCAGTGVSA